MLEAHPIQQMRSLAAIAAIGLTAANASELALTPADAHGNSADYAAACLDAYVPLQPADNGNTMSASLQSTEKVRVNIATLNMHQARPGCDGLVDREVDVRVLRNGKLFGKADDVLSDNQSVSHRVIKTDNFKRRFSVGDTATVRVITTGEVSNGALASGDIQTLRFPIVPKK